MAEDVFKALADPTRRRILDELVERDGQTLFEICARLVTKHGLGLSRQAISQHLAVLEAAAARDPGPVSWRALEAAADPLPAARSLLRSAPTVPS